MVEALTLDIMSVFTCQAFTAHIVAGMVMLLILGPY